MLRQKRGISSFCEKSFSKLILCVRKAFSCICKLPPSNHSSSSTSPQTFQCGQINQQQNQKKDYLYKFKVFQLSNQKNSTQFQQIAYQLAKIQSMLKYFGVFLICQIAVTAICFYLNYKLQTNSSTIQSENNDIYFFYILINVVMIFLGLLLYSRLRNNIKKMHNGLPTFMQRYQCLKKISTFIIFTAFSLSKVHLQQNRETAYFEALICVLIHQQFQQESQILSYILGIILSADIFIKMLFIDQDIQNVITVSFLIFSLVFLTYKCERNSELCNCKNDSRSRQENNLNCHQYKTDIEGEKEISSQQKLRGGGMGLCCRQCGKPYKQIGENVQQIEEELIQIMEEHKSLLFMINNLPQGYCAIDRKQQKIILANNSLLHRTNSIDFDILYKYINNLKVKIGNSFSFSDIDHQHKRQYSTSTNVVNPSKLGQQFLSRTNNSKSTQIYTENKLLQLNTNSRKAQCPPLYQNQQYNNNINTFSNNQLLQNNKYPQSFQQQQQQQQQCTNQIETEDNFSNPQIVVNNNTNTLQNSQSQADDLNTVGKSTYEESKKVGFPIQIKSPGCNSGNGYKRNSAGHNNQNNHDQLSRKHSYSQDENGNTQFQHVSQDQQICNQNFQQQFSIGKVNINSLQEKLQSSDNCSVNYTNFDASPIHHFNRYLLPLERELIQNNNNFYHKQPQNQNEINLFKLNKQTADYNCYFQNSRTEDGIVQVNQSNQSKYVVGQQVDDQQEQKKSLQTNLHNITEIDNSNIQFFDNSKTSQLNTNKTQTNPHTQTRIYQIIDQNEFQQRTRLLSQQIINHKRQSDFKKKNSTENYNKNAIDQSSNQNNIFSFQQTPQKLSQNSSKKFFGRRKSSYNQSVSRKRVFTENTFLNGREGENHNVLNSQYDKKEVNSSNQNSPFNLMNHLNSNSFGGQIFNLNEQDFINPNSLALEDLMNFPVLEIDSRYSFRLMESFGQFTSVNVIKENDDIFYFLFDDTEHRYILEQELLKELESFQTKVLKSISHEFGTPLNCAVNMLKICSMKVEQEINQNYILPALSSIRILKFSCSDFIDYSKIQFNCFKLDIRKTDLKHLLNKVVEYFQPLVNAQQQGKEGITLEFLAGTEVPDQIMSDPQRIMQVVFNLLTNALKFTQKGYIQIKASCLNEDEIEISVIDSGMGIQADQQDNLFERKTIRNKKQETSGLGLIISNALAQRLSYSGTGLNLISKLGEGSIFSFIVNVNCTDEFSKKRELQSRKFSQLTNKNQSQSDYNSITDFNQTIYPQYCFNNQLCNVQLLHQQYPMSPQIVYNRKMSNSNGTEVNQENNLKQDKFFPEQLSKHYLNLKSNKSEAQKKDPQLSNFVSKCEISCNDCNISELIINKKDLHVPESLKVSPSRQPFRGIELEDALKIQDEISSNRQCQNSGEGAIRSYDAGLSMIGLDELSGNNTKFITNLEQMEQKKNNKKLSLQVVDDGNANYKISEVDKYSKESNQDKSESFQENDNQLKRVSLERNFQSIQQLTGQISNIQLSSTTSIRYPKQNTTVPDILDNPQQQDTLQVLNLELQQKDTKTSSSSYNNNNISQTVPQQQNQQISNHLNQQDQAAKINDINIVVTDQKYGGGILSLTKKNYSPELKKKQLTFRNNNECNFSNYHNTLTEDLNQQDQYFQQIPLQINEDYHNGQKQIQFNQGLKQMTGDNRQFMASAKVIPSQINQRNEYRSQNDLKSYKDVLIHYGSQKKFQKQNLQQINIPNKLYHPNVQYSPMIIEDSKSSEALISTNSKQFIKHNNTNDYQVSQISDQSTTPNYQNNFQQDEKIQVQDILQTPSKKKNIPCDTSLVEHIELNGFQQFEVPAYQADHDQRNFNILLHTTPSSPLQSIKNGGDYNQYFQQISTQINNDTYHNTQKIPNQLCRNNYQGNRINYDTFCNNQLQLSPQNHNPHPNLDHFVDQQTPKSQRRVNQTICLSPVQSQVIQVDTPLSAGFQKKSKHYSQQNILLTQFANIRKSNTLINSSQIFSPTKHFSERLIAINDSLPPISSKLIQSKQSIKKINIQNHDDERNCNSKNENPQEVDEEIVSPLRAKCFSLQEQFSVINSQRYLQKDIKEQESPIKIQRKTARNRTRSEFGIKNTQEIKDALKNKICNCPDILIADDTQMNRHTLKLMIQSKFPFVIDEATNGQEAVDKVEGMLKAQNHCITYKMIFMDIDMPKLNGYEATEKINEIFKEKNIFCPVIAHTAFDRNEVQEEMNQCNMTDYAGKPISTAVIEQLFARYIDVSSITGEI